MADKDPVFVKYFEEQAQDHSTRKQFFSKIEKSFGKTLVTFFTSFAYPVDIEDSDAIMLEAVLQKVDLSNGLLLMINSPGGQAIAAEKIIQVCRKYSGTKSFEALVVDSAKSAATMVCFGAEKIWFGPTAELGPVDPQLAMTEGGRTKRFSAHNVVESYERLFAQSVRTKGKVEPFLQQLSHYDARDIQELKSHIALSEDISIRTLKQGMLSGSTNNQIKKKIDVFIKPGRTKIHARPIYFDEAKKCGLNVEEVPHEEKVWPDVYELYLRTNNYVTGRMAKCVESANHSFAAPAELFLRRDEE